jgi:hypothetical protein
MTRGSIVKSGILVAALAVIFAYSAAMSMTLPRVQGQPEFELGDFSDFLGSMDVVCEGRITRVQEMIIQRDSLNGSPSPYRAYACVVTVAVDRVIRGVFSDSVLILRMARGSCGDLGDNRARVLAWGLHDPSDGWHLWGSLARVRSDGSMEPTGAMEPDVVMLRGPTGKVPATIAGVRVKMMANSALQGPGMLEGKQGLALMRIVDSARRPGASAYTLRLVRWLVGSAATMPSVVLLRTTPICDDLPTTGDSLVVPVDVGVDTIAVNDCLNTMHVRYGYIPGLGTRVSELESVVHLQAGRLRLSQPPK